MKKTGHKTISSKSNNLLIMILKILLVPKKGFSSSRYNPNLNKRFPNVFH